MLPKSAFEAWLEDEGLPVYTGFGIEDVRAVSRGEWSRTGGKGAIFNLRGMDGFTAGYILEIAPHQTLHIQRHMFEEVLYAIQGQGTTTLSEAAGSKSAALKWEKGTLFAAPLNCSYELRNDSDEVALLFGATDMPLVMDLFYSDEFVFGSDNWFEDRFAAVRKGIEEGVKTYKNDRGSLVIEGAQIDGVHIGTNPHDLAGSAEGHGHFTMAGNTLAGHVAGEPVGKYDEAHYHGGGAIILILQSHGYSLLWPPEFGPRPFQNGFGDRVVRVEWREGSIISPPTAWFHQHFNLGNVPARNIAFRFGYGLSRPTRFYIGTYDVDGRTACTVGMRRGGTLVDFEDEDPEIHRMFEEGLRASAVKCAMDHSLFASDEVAVAQS